MKKTYMISFVIIICIIIGFVMNSISTDKQALNAMNENQYKKVINEIQNKFKIDGYTQLLTETMGNVVVVPNSVADRQDTNEGLYLREKHFVYKNKTTGVVILLSISSNNLDLPKRVWNHSIGYDKLFNSPDNKFKEYYSDVYPFTECYLYSFISTGYNISIMGISNNNSQEEVFTISKLAEFTDNLIEFIDSNEL